MSVGPLPTVGPWDKCELEVPVCSDSTSSGICETIPSSCSLRSFDSEPSSPRLSVLKHPDSGCLNSDNLRPPLYQSPLLFPRCLSETLPNGGCFRTVLMEVHIGPCASISNSSTSPKVTRSPKIPQDEWDSHDY